jgi:TP901 family phage tail tape measure protein
VTEGFKAGSVYYEADLETGNLIRQARDAERAVGRLEGAFTHVASAVASLVAALSIEAVVRGSVNASRQFEKAVADLSAITGATGDALKQLTAEAKALGGTTTASAGQVVEAMKLIASAKPELLETSGALAAVTKEAIALADASGMALPAAAEAVTLALNQFGEGADQASRFVNVLAAGAKFGASEISDTAIALKNSAVSAAAARVSFEETNAALQALAAGGIKGGEAGTALRNVILKLENEADKKLKPSINGLAGALANLDRQNLSSTELTKLFGLENVNAAQALLGSAEKVRELTAQLTGTQTAYEQAATNTATFDAQLKLMNNSLELAAIKLGDELRPAAEAGAKAVTAIAQAFIDGAPAIVALGTAIEVAAAVLLGRGVASLVAYTTALYAKAAAAGTATVAARAFTVALAAVGGPIGIAVGLLATLALNWDKIAGSANTAAEISEQAAERIAAASRKSAGAAKRDLEEQLAEIEKQLPEARRAPTNLRMGTYGGVGTPEEIAEAEARVKALEDAALRTRLALEKLRGGGRGDDIIPALVGSAPAAAPPPPPPPPGRTKAAGTKAAADDVLDQIRQQTAAEAKLEQLESDRIRAADERAAREAQDAERASQDQARGREFARGLAIGDDPVARLQLELEQKSALLREYAALDQENLALYAAAKVQLEQDTAARITSILQQEQLDRMAAQSQLIGATGNLFGSMAALAKQFAGEQSGTFRALFAISKGFAIADAGLKLNMAIMQALADPTSFTPAQKLANYAAIASAGGALISSIAGINFGGGRQYGGPVSAGSMYRVNETGAPEMFVGSGGRQYMLPTQSGQVVPADEVGGGGLRIVVNNFGSAEVETRQIGPREVEIMIDRRFAQEAAAIRNNEGQMFNALTSSTNVRSRL